MTAKNNIFPIIVLGILFFIFGFITWVNGILIPYLKIACELKTDFQSYMVAFAFFIAYTVMAIPSSYVLKWVGYKKGMSLGLFIMAVGAFLFVPAANTRNFDLFLIGLFIIGTGLALLQTASNPYATILGPIESAARRISIMGICSKVGGILALLILGYIALDNVDALEMSLKTMDMDAKNNTLNELAHRVVLPYITIGSVLIALAIAILFSGLPDIDDVDQSETANFVNSEKSSVFQFPSLVLGVVALFFYVGAEVIAGDTIISYGKSLGIGLAIAKYFTQGTLACMVLGYFVGVIVIPKYISQSSALKICTWLGLFFTIGAICSSSYVSITFIALLGLANSLMWPAIFPLAIEGLGKFTKVGSAMLIMAIAGGALLPLIYGKFADVLSPQKAYFILIPCYLFILYYATMGHKKRDW